MAGSISLSMSQQFDDLGKPLSGGLLYFIEAGTTSTPQNAYQDSDLTIAHPNPITLDSAGRVPQFYLADGSIKIRLTDSAGVQQLAADNVLVVGPSSGSGGGGSVDATTVLATGDIKSRYGTGTLSGWVRLNGRTIGSATSGATERANADAQALFEYLYGADANLAVSGGRGASANADWIANKTITLPDGRGMVLAGLDDMGNIDAQRLAHAFGSSNKTLGASTNKDYEYLTQDMLPAVSPTFTGTLKTGWSATANISQWVDTPSIGGISANPGGTSKALSSSAVLTDVSITLPDYRPLGTISPLGSGLPHRTDQPTLLVTNYIKL